MANIKGGESYLYPNTKDTPTQKTEECLTFALQKQYISSFENHVDPVQLVSLETS